VTGKGGLSQIPQSRFNVLVMIQLVWLLLVLALGAWWTHLLAHKAERIVELETLLSTTLGGKTTVTLEKTQRMIFWESATFLTLLVAITVFLFWTYWISFKRTRGLQAFFASVTHELRTPLTSIRLQAESLQDAIGESAPKRTQNLVDRLLEDTFRLESQVEQTLELARVESGGQVAQTPIELGAFIEREARFWEETYRSKLDITLELDNSRIYADPAALRGIFRNLLENAVKHGHDGTQKLGVKITCEAIVGPALASGEVQDSGRVRLVVEDQGQKTISTAQTQKLGTLFEKGPNSSGAGVGLYLVKTLMERMGGGAQFTSQNRGFRVELDFRKVGEVESNGS
jgi:signal transduction histidine kinase